MKEIILQLETEIKKLDSMSEYVTWHADEALNIQDTTKVEDFLILHKARLDVLLIDLKKLLV